MRYGNYPLGKFPYLVTALSWLFGLAFIIFLSFNAKPSAETSLFDWLFVFALDIVLLTPAMMATWSLFKNCKAVFDEHGISQPTLLGLKSISWDTVKKVQRGDFGAITIESAKSRITIYILNYQDPQAIIEFILSKSRK